MPKVKKLRLDDLKVKSFVTGNEQREIIGGSGSMCGFIACPDTGNDTGGSGSGSGSDDDPIDQTVNDATCIDWYCGTILQSVPPQIAC